MTSPPLFKWFFCILAGYLGGSLMFCRLLPRLFLHVDICENSDDHNPGASNVFHQCGPVWGSLCLALDVMKGFLPVFWACRYLNTGHLLFALVLAAPVLGHATAPLYRFHGGKCIATAFGELLALFPYNRIGVILAFFYILFSTLVKINPNRVRSIAAFGIFGFLSIVILIPQHQYAVALGCVLISAIAIFRHSLFASQRTAQAYSK